MKKNITVAAIGLISLVYLTNPTGGIIELIPDIALFIGNLDEATAMTLFLASLRHFGLDVGNIFKKNEKNTPLKP